MPSRVEKMAADDNATPAHAMVTFSRGYLPLCARVLASGLPRYSRTWSVSLKTVLSVFHQPLWISIVLGGLAGGLNCGNRVLIRGRPRKPGSAPLRQKFTHPWVGNSQGCLRSSQSASLPLRPQNKLNFDGLCTDHHCRGCGKEVGGMQK